MIDTYSKLGFAKLYDSKTPVTAAEILNDRVLLFFDEQGIIASRMGNRERAESEFKQSLAIDPKYGDAHFNLALLCERRGDALRAVHHWKAYLKIDSASNWADIARRQLEKLRVALLS